jgi:hypothetical protein
MNDADQLQRQSPAAGGRCSSHSFLEKIVMGDVYRNFVQAASAALLAIVAALPGTAMAQTVPAFHFESICRSDPGTNKNIVRLVLHGPDVDYQDGTFQQTHAPLAGVTINVLWSYVDYRQNRAVFKYRQSSCTTANDGSCTFNGGSGRARWQLSEVVGYSMSSPAFDTVPTATCPNTTMIDFW